MGLDILSQMTQGNAQAAQGSYQAAVARNSQAMAERTAAIQERNAQYAEQQGAADESRQRLKTAQAIGSQRAAMAGQGADINSGSPVDILGDTARAGELDAQTIRADAARKAYNFRLQGMNAQNQAGLFGAESANYARQSRDATDRATQGITRSLLGFTQPFLP